MGRVTWEESDYWRWNSESSSHVLTQLGFGQTGLRLWISGQEQTVNLIFPQQLCDAVWCMKPQRNVTFGSVNLQQRDDETQAFIFSSYKVLLLHLQICYLLVSHTGSKLFPFFVETNSVMKSEHPAQSSPLTTSDGHISSTWMLRTSGATNPLDHITEVLSRTWMSSVKWRLFSPAKTQIITESLICTARCAAAHHTEMMTCAPKLDTVSKGDW